MEARFVIHIRQQNHGWSCSQTVGQDRVFALKEQALQFARLQCTYISAEVRLYLRDGTEERFLLTATHPQEMFPQMAAQPGTPEPLPAIIKFAPLKHSWILRQGTGTNDD